MKKILFLLLFLTSLKVSAQMWYVDENGSDLSGDGSITKPWATVSHAADTIKAANGFSGDTIFVNAGTINEEVQIILSVPISLMGEGATSIIKFSYANTTWSNACIELESANEGTLGNQSISHLKIDGNKTAYHGILVGRRSNVSLHDLVMVDFRYNAINIRGSYVNETEPTIYATNNKIYNCSITNCSVKAYVGGASGDGQVRFSFQDGILVHDNILDNTLAAAGTAANNLDLKLGYNKNMQIYNNKSYKPDHNGADWNIHIESWDGMGGNHIYDNEFWGGGMQIDIGGHFNIKGTSDYSFLVENNLFTDTTQKAYVSGLFGCGITIEGDTRDVIVRRNYFSNIGKGIGINATEYADPVRIYDVIRVNIDYNIFENIGYTNENSWNIELVSESVNAVIEDIFIDNNTIISNPLIQSEAGLVISPKGTMSNIRLRNNIIQDTRLAPIYLFYYTGQVSNLYNQNNILYNNGNSNLILYATTPPVINYVVSDTIMTDPLFVGGSPYSYKLQATSPAKDAGISVGLTSDYGGYSVPVGSAPDIGAWEYGADVDPPDWRPQGIGWDPMYQKHNFRDTVNFTRGFMIAGVPISASGSRLEILGGLTATVNDLNNTSGSTGNLQGQINTLDNGKLEKINAPLATGTITDATGITAAMLSRYMYYSEAAATDISANPQIADGTPGQIITIIGSSDTNTLTLDDTDGLRLAGQCVLGIGDTITLFYDGTLADWLEIGRSAN